MPSHRQNASEHSPDDREPLPQANRPLPRPPRDYRWSNDNYSSQRRFVDIWSFVLRFLTESWMRDRKWTYLGGYSEARLAQRRRRQAVWIRDTFLELGPTFIKLGQLFSTRADLFPAEYVEELSKLQDSVPAFGFNIVETIVKRDFGQGIPDLFAEFDPVPIAAASLGQVHKAKLHSSEEVVVKVQRLGLVRLFTIDLEILRGIAKYFQRHPKWGKGRDWMGIYDECCRILWEETDYLNEGQNADTFRRNFREIDWVKVPRIFWRYSSPRVLTLEYIPGIKISNYEALEAAGIDRIKVSELNAKAYLQQLLFSGFFHADPHPGNLAVDPEGGGKLIFYDFGMMGKITSTTKTKLMEICFGIIQRDADRIIAAAISLGVIAQNSDTNPIRRSIQYLLDNFLDRPMESQSLTQISDDLYEIAYGQPFRFPATFTFVMRAFSTIEGVGKGLNPDFNFMEIAQPFAMQLTDRNNTAAANTIFGEISRQAAQVSTSALGLPRRIEDTIEKLDRGDIRLRVKSADTDRQLRRLASVQMSTTYSILLGVFWLSATALFVTNYIIPAAVSAGFSAIIGIILIRHLMRLGQGDRSF